MQKILYLELNITSVTEENPRQLIESKHVTFFTKPATGLHFPVCITCP